MIEITDKDINNLESTENLQFDVTRRDILRSLESLDIQACPGSGKTTLIAAKLILLAERWHFKHSGVCVLSHTNVAKDEIIARIEKSASINARKLLGYPHFIGTIQEFVNRFIGLPEIRSSGIDVRYVDDDACIEFMNSKLSRGTKIFVESRFINFKKFGLTYTEGRIGFDFRINAGPETPSYKELWNARSELNNQGLFFYRDMFIYAEKLITESAQVSKFLRRRFPYVLVDEMQDTLLHQDELISKIFVNDETPSVLQRFGDPDQEIYGISGVDRPNVSYNSKTIDQMYGACAVVDSNRFSKSIADKISGLSKNKVPLRSAFSPSKILIASELQKGNSDFGHTIILYDDHSILKVLPSFVEIILNNFKVTENLILKAVGGNGSENSAFTIRNYFPTYDSISQNSATHDYLIDAIRQFVFFGSSSDVADAILKLLRISKIKDANDKNFTLKTLEDFLNANNDLETYRKLMFEACRKVANNISKDEWDSFASSLMRILKITSKPNFLLFRHSRTGESPTQRANLYCENDVEVTIGTIHSVKGETHDATLILETKNGQFDVSSLLPWLVNSARPVPAQAKKLKFMKELYVAMSRPKHLLCIAINKSNISDGKLMETLRCDPYNWKILDLTLNPEEKR
ncbi:UvrD-helicase domain-containing protein [Bdellovibrio sp. KM01]|nr:UvrD-helicase domain-containing protein [Bdellovibrio sp. KM01]